MSQLDDILTIGDNEKRQKALIEYANSLKVNHRKAKSKDGQLSENELIVLIYDAVTARKRSGLQNIGLFLGAVFLIGIVMAALMMLKVMISSKG